MKPKLCVVTFGKLSEVLLEESRKISLPVDIHVCNMLLSPSSSLPDILDDAGVILSSGYNARVLKQKTEKPVITMEPSVYDLLRALIKAREFDASPLVISFARKFSLVDGIEDILKLNFEQEIFNEREDLDGIILRHRTRGGKCIIGTALGCARADALGMRSVHIYPQEAVQSYLQTAAETAISMEKELRKNRQLSAIVNHANSGIILTDQEGRVIICNPVGQSFFAASFPSITGVRLDALFADPGIANLVHAKSAVRNRICTIGDARCILDAFPILIRGNLSNLLITISGVSSIQKTEYHIRKSLTQKGFVAKSSFERYTTTNPGFKRLIGKAQRFSQSDEAVVILGETGTGKEVLAQSIHNNSARAKYPFVAVNCSAINSRLLESELFGYDEGAFTGARKGGKEGLFELAHQGSIFLDEIGDIDPAMQAKLLRVIQEKQIMRVGGTRIIPFDARIIAATNQRLWELVQQRKFREDLYYRINVLELSIPPLRERKEDIFILFCGFLKEKLPAIERTIRYKALQLEQLLCSYPWPGNIRELQNLTKMLLATIDADSSPDVIFDMAEEFIQSRTGKVTGEIWESAPLQERDAKHARHPSVRDVMSPAASRAELERIRIQSALRQNLGNQSKAAVSLGISRVTLWRKMRLYGLAAVKA